MPRRPGTRAMASRARTVACVVARLHLQHRLKCPLDSRRQPAGDNARRVRSRRKRRVRFRFSRTFRVVTPCTRAMGGRDGGLTSRWSPSCRLPCSPSCPAPSRSAAFSPPVTTSPSKLRCRKLPRRARTAAFPRVGCTAATRACCVICPGRVARQRSGSQHDGSGASTQTAPAKPSPKLWTRWQAGRRGARPGSAIYSATSGLRSAVKRQQGWQRDWPSRPAPTRCCAWWRVPPPPNRRG